MKTPLHQLIQFLEETKANALITAKAAREMEKNTSRADGMLVGLSIAIKKATKLLEAETANTTNNQFKIDFTKGYTNAVANFLNMHDEFTYCKHIYQCNFHTVKELQDMGVDESDIEALKPIIAEMERKRRLNAIADDIHKTNYQK